MLDFILTEQPHRSLIGAQVILSVFIKSKLSDEESESFIFTATIQ